MSSLRHRTDTTQTPHLLRYHLLGVLCWLYPVHRVGTPEFVVGSSCAGASAGSARCATRKAPCCACAGSLRYWYGPAEASAGATAGSSAASGVEEAAGVRAARGRQDLAGHRRRCARSAHSELRARPDHQGLTDGGPRRASLQDGPQRGLDAGFRLGVVPGGQGVQEVQVWQGR